MTIRASVMFPIYFTLSPEQELEYHKLQDDDKENYLLDLADHYLQTSSVEPVLEYVDDDTFRTYPPNKSV